jgi:hypothetical protein
VKDESLWRLLVRKPLRWCLRRFLPAEAVDETLATIEELVRAASEG